MTEPAITPGPWTVYDDRDTPNRRIEIVAMGKTVAHIYCTKGDYPEDLANASLIGTAPDLYAALEATVRCFDLRDGMSIRDEQTIKHAAFVLAKAQGIEARRAATGTGAVHESPVG